MRFLVTLLLWLLTTAALVVAVPSAWAQQNVIDRDGYADLAASAAEDPGLQEAMAAELTAQVTALAADNGYNLNPDLVRQVASGYTGNEGFPGQFAQANRIAHEWMFTTDAPQGQSGDQWLVDIAPMLSDESFRATLGDLDLQVPETLTVPITVPSPELRPGRLQAAATWGPWISVGATVLTGVLALLTLASSRSRGKTLAALGVSGLLVGAGGWAGVEVARRYIDDGLNRVEGDFRRIAEAMVNHAEGSLHHWLNLTLAAGGALVVLGIVAAMLGGLVARKT